MVNKGVMRQYLVATAVSLSIMSVGITLGWTSPIMEELTGPSSPVPMSTDQYSWLVSIYSWGVILCSIPFSAIADRWGRRTTLRIIGPMSLITWTTTLFVNNVWGLLAVRFTQGLLMAAAYTVVPVYTGEIAGPKIRGSLGTIFQVMLHAGIVYAYAAGAWLDFRRLTYAVLVFHVGMCAALFAGIPETPHYYAMKNRRADAKRSIEWLRGGGGGDVEGNQVEGELDAMLAENSVGVGKRPTSLTELFADRVNLKSLILVQALSVYRITGGVMIIIPYASVTLAEMRVNYVPVNMLSLAFGVLMLVWTVACTALADRMGRRTLMIASSAFCCAFNAFIGAYMYLDRRTAYDVADYGWLCAAAVVGLSAAYCVGLGSLFSTINCELFACHTRAAANAVNTVTLLVFGFIALKLYPIIADGDCMYRNFLIFSAGSLASTVTCWMWLPETKGKTFADIQAQLRGR